MGMVQYLAIKFKFTRIYTRRVYRAKCSFTNYAPSAVPSPTYLKAQILLSRAHYQGLGHLSDLAALYYQSHFVDPLVDL